ncbi:Protein phosphatase 2C 7 [Microbotryomycetes sp. JL221]|nr:Protein phosphatase 2C 7 [Microbotryomycetes sp. JL221]
MQSLTRPAVVVRYAGRQHWRAAPSLDSIERARVPPRRRALSTSVSWWAYRLSTAYSFHGKPGSKRYTPGQDQDDSGSDVDEADGDSSTIREQPVVHARPDWRARQSRVVRQGFDKSHPVAQWRDAILRDCPWGAGEDWFMLDRTSAMATQDAASQLAGKGGVTDAEAMETVVMAVADGVGGWTESGVDPSHFSQALMFYAHNSVNQGTTDPKKILEEAYDQVLKEKRVVAGSSTACVLAISDAGQLRAANLGDSTFLIIRPQPTSQASSEEIGVTYKVVHSQPAQVHFFNAPRQLSKMPKGASKVGALIDFPAHADLFETKLQSGDIVLAATDGYSDNVHTQELEQLIALVRKRHDEMDSNPAKAQEEGETRSFAQLIADVAVNFARLCSFKPDKTTPFELEARRYGHRDLTGGKVDDVCVVVTVVDEIG